MEYAPEEVRGAKINGGIFQVIRLHELQDMINRCWRNPLAFNTEEGSFNFELIFSSSQSMLSEVWPKLEVSDKKESLKLSSWIEQQLILNPIYRFQNERGGEPKIIKDNWLIMKKALQYFDLIVRGYLEQHGLTNPSMNDQDLF